MNKCYEIVFIVRQDATSNLVESIAASVSKVVKDSGGDITKTEFCGLRAFAYPIKKSKKGHYVLLNAICDGEVIFELDRQLRINEDVVRHLSVRVEALDSNPSALMQSRHYRESFDDDDVPSDNVPEVVAE
ncbi:MAG: 30S ribosomal protein S6 [Holosporales bacterium]|jgi:small subunit ribosomal protein S6|nr:30S ribosomal protein S6 [Holosporales bacterium]